MDLVTKLKAEIACLNLTDKLEIAYYLYTRVGEIFEYNPAFIFMSKNEQDEIIENDKSYSQILDINNIDYNQGICYRLSYILQKLASAFGIEADVVEIEKNGNHHAFVRITIDGKIYELDLTKNYEDFTLIKLGLKVKNFKRVFNDKMEKDNDIEKIEEKFYEKGIKSRKLIEYIFQKQKAFKILDILRN